MQSDDDNLVLEPSDLLGQQLHFLLQVPTASSLQWILSDNTRGCYVRLVHALSGSFEMTGCLVRWLLKAWALRKVHGDILVLQNSVDLGGMALPVSLFLWWCGLTRKKPMLLMSPQATSCFLMMGIDSLLWDVVPETILVTSRFTVYGHTDAVQSDVVWNSVNPRLEFFQQFSFPSVTEDLLDYLQNQALVIELWGTQGKRCVHSCVGALFGTNLIENWRHRVSPHEE